MFFNKTAARPEKTPTNKLAIIRNVLLPRFFLKNFIEASSPYLMLG
jgi:hypothetical protein